VGQAVVTAVNDCSRQFPVASARVTRGVIMKRTLSHAREARCLGEHSPDDPEPVERALPARPAEVPAFVPVGRQFAVLNRHSSSSQNRGIGIPPGFRGSGNRQDRKPFPLRIFFEPSLIAGIIKRGCFPGHPECLIQIFPADNGSVDDSSILFPDHRFKI
jgi:hypothetical protein